MEMRNLAKRRKVPMEHIPPRSHHAEIRFMMKMFRVDEQSVKIEEKKIKIRDPVHFLPLFKKYR
jgi:hypothetical protein